MARTKPNDSPAPDDTADANEDTQLMELAPDDEHDTADELDTEAES